MAATDRRATRRPTSEGLGIVVVVAAIGCGDPDQRRAPTGPEAVATAVPDQLRALDVDAACVARRAGERLVSVSPEGDAWLQGAFDPEAGISVWRILRPSERGLDETDRSVALQPETSGLAWNASRAHVVDGDRLFRIESESRVELEPPKGWSGSASLCGDPESDGVVVSGGSIARRVGDSWLSFRPEGDGLARPDRVLTIEGACAERDARAWITTEAGELFALTASSYREVAAFGTIDDAAASPDRVVVASGDSVWVSEFGEWTRLRFSRAATRSVAASTGWAWMSDGVRVVGHDGSDFVAYTPAEASPIDAIAAHSSGVWTTNASSICHAEIRPRLRIEGLRPLERVREESRVVCLDDDEATLSLDAAPIELTSAAEALAARCATLTLDTLGWHELVVARGGARRTIEFERVMARTTSFEVDVLPRYRASCASAGCHNELGTPGPDLAELDAWTARREAIERRVVDDRTMPPTTEVGWTDEDVATIERWLEEGMLP